MAMKSKTRCLDLFSGIGGFALALREVCKPVMFSESDPASVRVLEERFPGIPVSVDVRRLRAQEIRHAKPDMITAGFPCQDISCLRVQKDALGIHGERSKLFFELPRLLRQVPTIKHVFLENSPCIYDRGLDDVVKSLKQAGMTHFAYGVFSAESVGAVHSRRRWFCLATKAPSKLPIMSTSSLKRVLDNEWNSLDAYHRVVPRKDNAHAIAIKKRLSMLGNAVVPQCAAYAYHNLSTSLTTVNTEKSLASRTTPVYKKTTMIIPEKGNLIFEVPRLQHEVLEQFRPPKNRDLGLRLQDNSGRCVKRRLWRTPTSRESSWNQARRMTDRALWNLANMIYYERNTHCASSSASSFDVSDMSRWCIINPHYIEIMMGYPLGWTA